MRTLKRTMCLVLSMVMLLGLCALPAFADGTNLEKYPDANTITYKEAVDVLTGIGVLQGDARGFRPTDRVTRAEAAKIIAYLLIGDAAAADALKAQAQTFSDVPTDNWAAGYIAYCYEQGIVNGKGNGIYDPNGNVTGIEFGKMLLSAIGYGVKNEYTGAAWAINVAKDGVQYGVYDGNLAGASEVAATREECALYAFNTLVLAKVTYSELFGGYIENWAQASQAQSNKEATIADDYGLGTTEFSESGIIHRLGVRRYSVNDVNRDSDMFYRPLGHYWFQRQRLNSITGYYGGEEWLKAKFDRPVTGADLFDALGADIVSRLYSNTNALPLYVYENGADYRANEVNEDDEFALNCTNYRGNRPNNDGFLRYDDSNAIRRGNNDVMTDTGYGVETSVYVISDYNGDPVEVRIILVHQYLAQVASYKAAASNSPASIVLNLPNGYDSYQRTIFTDRDFETNDFRKDDYVLFTYSFRNDHVTEEAGIQEVKTPSIISSKITSYTNVKGEASVGANGTTYFIAKDDAVMNSSQTRGNEINRGNVNGTVYSIFTDGKYIIGVDAAAQGRKNFVYVTEYGYRFTTLENDLHETLTLTAMTVDNEGNKKVIYVDTDTETEGNTLGTSLLGVDNATLLADWERVAMQADEKAYVEGLNATSKGLYFMSTNSKGRSTLIDLETYASTRNTRTVNAIGENQAAGRALFRGIAGLRTIETANLVNGDNTNQNVNLPVTLYADANTVFYYLNSKGNFDEVKVGISRATTVSGSNNVGTTAWYGEYVADETMIDRETGRVMQVAYAQVVLVSKAPVDDPEEKKVDGPVYIYVDDSEDANKPGSYVKIDNGDGTWTVDFNVIKAGESERTVKSVLYENEDAANTAIDDAGQLINSWVLVDTAKGKGVTAFKADEEGNEHESKEDKAWYVDATRVREVRATNDGYTVFYDAIFRDSAEEEATPHYRGVEITGDEMIFDVRKGVSASNRINTLDELAFIAEGRDLKGVLIENPADRLIAEVLIAFDKEYVVTGLYVVDLYPMSELGE